MQDVITMGFVHFLFLAFGVLFYFLILIVMFSFLGFIMFNFVFNFSLPLLIKGFSPGRAFNDGYNGLETSYLSLVCAF